VDCDYQIGLVKRDNYADTDITNIAGVSRLPFRIAIDSNRIGNHAFYIGQLSAQTSQFVLGMPREAHAPPRLRRRKISPHQHPNCGNS
jgi:hypothetical protein